MPGRAVFLSGAEPLLIVADVHLGKSAAFRARGLAVPEGDSLSDLARITELVRQYQPARLVVNGDLFHAPAGITPEIRSMIGEFVEELEIPLTLVGGNHDMKIRDLPAGIKSVSSLEQDGVTLIHDPADVTAEGFHITGHWHPVVRIADRKRMPLRLPCFLLRGQMLVLPAFGNFTGGLVMRPEPGDRFFVAPAERVIEVPPALL